MSLGRSVASDGADQRVKLVPDLPDMACDGFTAVMHAGIVLLDIQAATPTHKYVDTGV